MLGCNVDGVVGVEAVRRSDMGMVLRPCREGLSGTSIDLMKFANLQPAENGVEIIARLGVPNATIRASQGAAKPTEEKEDVANANPLVPKMGLIAASLTEYGTPASLARKAFFIKVRIGMSFVFKWQWPVSQFPYDGTQRPSSEGESIIRVAMPSWSWDGKR